LLRRLVNGWNSVDKVCKFKPNGWGARRDGASDEAKAGGSQKIFKKWRGRDVSRPYEKPLFVVGSEDTDEVHTH